MVRRVEQVANASEKKWGDKAAIRDVQRRVRHLREDLEDDKRHTKSTKTIKVSRTAAGAGRWTYCKYCYKNVQPFVFVEEWMDGWQRLLCCSECGSGLAILDRAGTMPVGKRHGGLAD